MKIGAGRRLALLPLTVTVFFCVSGGPNGLEELVKESGAAMAVLLVLLTPLVWAAPAALMTAELASAIPAEGGYYIWVKRAMGPFWGFLCAWWTWVYSWIDVAIYPVLFADLLAVALKAQGIAAPFEHDPNLRWLVALAVIVPFTWLNVRGVRTVGLTSEWLFVLLMLPFLAMFAIGLSRGVPHLGPIVSPGQNITSSLGAGLLIVMWNYLGWDSLSTIAEEVEQPHRAFPKALLVGVLAVTGIYLLAVLSGYALMPHPEKWVSGVWPEIARLGAPWLFWPMAAANLISAAGLFNATLLGASRIPFVLAEDRFLPRGLTKLHPKHGTPVAAILTCAVLYSLLARFNFEELVELDVLVYSAGLFLEFMALLALRAKEPALVRPFRIPGGWPIAILVVLLPMALAVYAVVSAVGEQGSAHGPLQALALGIGLLATGPVAYMASYRLRATPTNESAVP